MKILSHHHCLILKMSGLLFISRQLFGSAFISLIAFSMSQIFTNTKIHIYIYYQQTIQDIPENYSFAAEVSDKLTDIMSQLKLLPLIYFKTNLQTWLFFAWHDGKMLKNLAYNSKILNPHKSSSCWDQYQKACKVLRSSVLIIVIKYTMGICIRSSAQEWDEHIFMQKSIAEQQKSTLWICWRKHEQKYQYL